MPKVGIRKTAQGFALVQPTSEKSAVVQMEENLLENLLANETSAVAQELLGTLYYKTRESENWYTRAWNTFTTETAFWHIHGILVTALLAISIFFTTALAAGAVAVETATSTRVLGTLVVLSYAASAFGFYALFTKRRPLKKISALTLFMLFLYLLLYLTLRDGANETLTISLLSLAGVAIALYSEWSRPRR